MTKATHNGTCQVCGNQQAVKNGVLVNHGYTVDYGYFNGICNGTGHAPLEHDTTLTTETIVRITQYAEELKEIEIGQIIQVPVRIRQDRFKYKTVLMNREEFDAHYEGESAYRSFTFESAAEYRLKELYRRADSLLLHAKDLKKLIQKRHGQPLIERASLEPLRERHVFTDIRACYAKADELKEQGFKTRVVRDRYNRNSVTLTATKQQG